MNGMKSKICNKCKEEHLLEEFHKDKNTKDGRKNTCKKCISLDYRMRVFNKEDLPKSKRCNICKEEHLLEEFHINKQNKDGRQNICKKCRNLQKRGAKQEKKLIYYSILDAYSDRVCTKCGYTADVWAPFDWHHVDASTKLDELSQMTWGTEEKIIAELNKCILLCSNCHRLHHYLEK